MHFDTLVTKGRIEHEPIMAVNIFGVNLFQRTTISVHAEDRAEQIYTIIKDHVSRNYTQDQKLTEQLVEFQKMHVARHQLLTQYPLSKQSDYNFIGYLLEDEELHMPTQYQFNFAEDKSMSLTTFCEQILFSRRKNFGKTIITKPALTSYLRRLFSYPSACNIYSLSAFSYLLKLNIFPSKLLLFTSS